MKADIASELPYLQWLEECKIDNHFEEVKYEPSDWDESTLFRLQKQFAYTKEDINKYMADLVTSKKDPIGAMGYDAPIAVLNDKPESLFNYFKQLFAQVTNPPIDAYREKIVTSELSYLGAEGNLLHPDETALQRIQLKKPVLTEAQLAAIDQSRFNVTHLSTVYTESLEAALEDLGERAIEAVKSGAKILVLDDQSLVSEEGFAMPMLLALSHIHQLLIREELRMETSLVAQSGETREVHHVACLLGYGANAVVPYLAQRTVEQLTLKGQLAGSVTDNVETYTQVLSEGVIKVMAKMGISTVQSYQRAQIFEAVGLSQRSSINTLLVRNLNYQVLVLNKSIKKIKQDRVIHQTTLNQEVHSNGDNKVNIMRLILVLFSYYNMLVEIMIMSCLRNFPRQSIINVRIIYDIY